MSSYGCTQPTPAIINTPHQRAHSVMAVPSELMQHRAYRRKDDQQQQRTTKSSSSSNKTIVWYQEVYKKYGYESKHNNKPTFFGPYLLLQTLGEGEFAKVKAAVHGQTNQEVAIKLMKKEHIQNAALETKLKREITILKSVNHRHIVRLFEVLAIKNYIGIVMQRAAGGELFDYILKQHSLQEPEAKRLFAQLISGVDYMHKKQIVHRDLKLENLLLSKERNIIITDFGFANSFTNDVNGMMATSCGSPCYAAPELVINESSTYAGTGVDIWSCGVILFAMLCGYLPFDDDPSNPQGANINALYRYIVSTPVQVPKTISAEATHLLRRMLVPNPSKRCTMEEIKKHPWLQEYAHIFDEEDTDGADEQSTTIIAATNENEVSRPNSFVNKGELVHQQLEGDNKEAIAVLNQGVDTISAANTLTKDEPSMSIDVEATTATNKRKSSSSSHRNSSSPTVDEVVSLGVANMNNDPEIPSTIEENEAIPAVEITPEVPSMTNTSSTTLVVPTVPSKQLQQDPKVSIESTSKKVAAKLDKPLPMIATTEENNSNSFSGAGSTSLKKPTSPKLPTKLLSALQKESTITTEATKSSYRKSIQQSIFASLQHNKIITPNRSQSVFTGTPVENTQAKQRHFSASISTSIRNIDKRNEDATLYHRQTIDIQPSASERTTFLKAFSPEQSSKSKGQRLVDWFKKLPTSHSTRMHLGTPTTNTQKQNVDKHGRPHNAMPDPNQFKSANKTFSNVFVTPSSGFDDSKLKFHKGAIDQDALTAISPYKTLDRIKDSLRSMGIEMKKCHDYKLKCTRPARNNKQPHPMKELSSTTMKTRKRLSSLFSHHPRESAASQTNRLLINRKQPQPPHQQSTAASQTAINSTYGDKVFDAGEEVQFSVEISKIAYLTGLYVVNIKRIRGNIWAFKYLYHRLLESLDLKNNNSVVNKKEEAVPQQQYRLEQRQSRKETKKQPPHRVSHRNEDRRKSNMTSSSGSSSSMMML